LGRLIQDYQSRELAEGSKSRFQPFRCSAHFRGLHQFRRNGKIVSRAVRYHDETSRLVEVQVITPAGKAADRRLMERLLASLSVTSRADQARRWSVFDLSLVTPPHFQLVRTSVKPADATLSFAQVDPKTGKPTRTEASLRRLGMARAWFAGNLKQLVLNHDKKTGFSRFSAVRHRGYEALLAEGTEPGPPLRRVLRLLRQRRVLAWSAAPENAVYELATLSPPQHPVLPAEFDLLNGAGADQ
jgi:hypothetical protein